MLPDFIETKNILKDHLRNLLIKRTSHHGVFPDNIRNIPLYECISYDQTRFDGSQETKKLEKLQGRIVLTKESLNEKGFVAVLEAYEKAAKEIAYEQQAFFFRRFDEIIKNSGQEFDAKGKPFTPELLLEILEKNDLDFDENGDPIFPTIFTGKNLFEQVKKWQDSKEYKKKLDELIERKYSEWRYHESNRKLVN